MKRYGVWIAVALVAVVLGGCAGMPKGPQFIDYEGKDFGAKPPEFYFEDASALENSREYEDYYVFKFESEPSKSKQGARMMLENFDVPREAARIVSTRVKDKAATAVVGDNDFVEAYMEEVVQVLAETQVSGMRKVEDFWVLKRYTDPNGQKEDLYTYYVLYTVPRDTMDRMVTDALNGVQRNKPDTEEEKTAISRVKEAFSEGF